ncbi:MAG: hypothetical protein ACFHX7_15895 [Pseudomonadota bacterium]
MRKRFIALTLGLGFSVAVNASPLVDHRGYQVCEAELKDRLPQSGLVTDRRFFFKESTDKRTYFINATVWSDLAERAAVTATCETSPNGREVMNLEMRDGEFAPGQDQVALR